MTCFVNNLSIPIIYLTQIKIILHSVLVCLVKKVRARAVMSEARSQQEKAEAETEVRG